MQGSGQHRILQKILVEFASCIFLIFSLPTCACCASCRVISRAPGLKLVVETLITSLRPIGNIVLICCAFFIVFGILGVQVNICLFFYSLLVEDKAFSSLVFIRNTVHHFHSTDVMFSAEGKTMIPVV